MKAKRYTQRMATALLLAGMPLAWGACSDNWNEHYAPQSGGMADQPSLLAALESDASLAQFLRVVKATGMDTDLNSAQMYTIWAPAGLTPSQADSVIAVYETDRAAGLKREDNRAVTQFLQNHMALYARPVSSLTDDTVSMLNRKYMTLKGQSSTSGTLQGNPFSDGRLCNNGILYKAQDVQTFLPNVRQYIEQRTDMDSLRSFIAAFDKYELDEQASVAGGVVDGKTVYLDSVTYLTNPLLASLGYIQREDSTYTLLTPTDELWRTEYAKYRRYFNYNSSVNKGDSLTENHTKLAILTGRFFNTSPRQRHNRAPEDSLVNTSYSVNQEHNPRQNVYYKPQTGILAGLRQATCSNGVVYPDAEGRIDPRTTFFSRLDIPAYYGRYYEVPKGTDNVETMNVSRGTYSRLDSLGQTMGQARSYTTVTAKTPSAQTSISYTLPGTFSGCYYNIYLVTVPDVTTRLPLWFQVSQQTANASGTFPTTATYFSNPHPVTAGSVDNADVILAQSNNARCFVASAEKMDTILIQAAVPYTYSAAGLDDGVVRLNIGSFGPSSSRYRETIYTRTLRLNEIILVPFETKEEAEAAADNLDAFNDEILEANKNN